MNIAEIGFKAQTGELKDAKASLDALVPSATRAEQAANKFNRAAAGITSGAGGASAGIRSFANAAAGATGGADRLTKAALSAGSAMGTVQRAAAGASAPLNNLTGATVRLNTAMGQADAHIAAYRAHLAQLKPAADDARNSLNRLGDAANDNINRLQATPGNIAAQFQDIGVTAAAGMNPLLIALQQGSQLVPAMSGGLANLKAAFGQLFSPMSLVTVALVALIAYAIQWAMEAATASGETDKLAKALDTVTLTTSAFSDVQSALGVVIDLTTGKITTQSDALYGLARAQLEVVRATALRDQSEARKAMNDIGRDTRNFSMLGAMTVGALPDRANEDFGQAQSMVENVLGNFRDGLVGATDTINALETMREQGRLAEDQFISLTEAVSNFGMANENLRQYEQGRAALGGSGSALRPYLTPGSNRSGGRSEAEKAAEAYADLVASTERRIAALRTETTALGMSENAAMLYRNQQELIAQATEKNIPLTDAMRAELDRLAHTLSDAELGRAMADATKGYQDQQQVLRDQAELIGLTGRELLIASNRQQLINDAVRSGVIDLDNMTDAMRAYIDVLNERAITLAIGEGRNNASSFMFGSAEQHQQALYAMQRERGEIGLIGRELIAYRRETELLVSARKQNLDLSPEQIAALHQEAQEYALIREEVDLARMRTELFRDVQMGFMTDMISGLRQGKSAWKSFADAVMNVANKIFDKLLEVVSSQAFQSFTNPGGGGLFGSLLRGFRMFVGGGPSAALAGDVSATMNANAAIFARGAAFGVEKFAQGGAFTNGIYTRPTLFKFAQGAALGEMGEAGPEAVMPLKRGPNGSLGVVAHERGPIEVVVTTNDDRFNAYVDDRSRGQVELAAPTIAQAGSKMAQRTAAIRGSRSIG